MKAVTQTTEDAQV